MAAAAVLGSFSEAIVDAGEGSGDSTVRLSSPVNKSSDGDAIKDMA